MRTVLPFTAITAFSLLLHVVLGWEWTLLAGLGAGIWFGRSGWMFGSLAVGLEWLLVVGYDFAVDARAVGTMTRTLGSMLGNLPGFAVVGITLLIGLALGALGGAAGGQIAKT